ncbi:kinase-like domain-containing protein [Microdochium trichocladiopsis]|uniref:Kinase-like domain-containing protein n=1 Tax=Microdochium trichocladiopsis TaxID=1682393 RepID=A0A9P8Y0H7_9PEZI|nr:kinase-like domain-containing protein [Microdochium trichocladiopsis]KAH7026478.1 kinase-like domain-containing protein [Microdochium trichocladiopsis]
MATTASPTPAGPAPSRKPSLRSGLRRAPSRAQPTRAESYSAAPTYASKSSYEHHESSDDEIPVPMKLSAITKALLNDNGPESDVGHGRMTRTRAQAYRASSPAVPDQDKPVKRRSVLGSSATSSGEVRRSTRASSAQLSSQPNSPVRNAGDQGSASRDNSPIRNRKRIVRLSATSGRGSTASAVGGPIEPSKRRNASLSASQSHDRSANADSSVVEDRANVSEVREREVNTPSQQNRIVRIAVGSSGGRGRSVGSGSGSAVSSSTRPEASSFRSQHSNEEEIDFPAPSTVSRQQPQANQGSISRPGSNSSRNRVDESQVAQSAVRVKRIAKVPGSFMSGPARRGRARQSEEGPIEGDVLQNSQDAEAQEQDLIDLEPLDNFASSYYAPDRVASGSPVSSRAAQQAAQLRSSLLAERVDFQIKSASPERLVEIQIPNHQLPVRKVELPSQHDQENEAPPSFKRPAASASDLFDKDPIVKIPSRLQNAELGNGLRPASPARRALHALSENTPRRAAPAPPPKMSILDAATSTAGAATTATTANAAKRRNYMKVNGKCYTRLDCLGRGGSGKVYRVAADNGKMFALKRVSVEGADENTVRGLKGEIDLLKKLTSVDRVVTLFDYDMNEEKQVLSLLMEMGEMDFNTLLRIRLSPEEAKFDPVFVRYYWQEMLECLSAVHAHDIVHSDLKPANFVLVQGRLKLIDFGIANAIQTEETVNVHRETQVGTPSYMSPESLIDSNTADPNASRRVGTNGVRPKLVKLGKPSDIWSLGCILFQMVYGQSPFGHIPNQMARCHAIINWQYPIEFRDRGIGDVPVPLSLLRTMKRCLNRDQHVRPTCQELLSFSDPFLYPVETPQGSLPISEDLLGRIVQSVVARCRERMPTDAEAMSVWPQAYWNSVAKASGKDPRSLRASTS